MISSDSFAAGWIMETTATAGYAMRLRVWALCCLGVAPLVACAAPTATSGPVGWQKVKLSTGDDPHLPATIGGSRCDSTLVGTYRLCLARDGGVQSVDVVAGIPEADDSIVATLRGWRYRPLPLPLCFEQNLAFRVECRGTPSSSPAGAAPQTSAGEVASRTTAPLMDVGEAWFVEQKMSRDDDPPAPPELQQAACGERLRGRYRLCINPTGSVSSVTPLAVPFDASGQIAAALKSWRFRPQSAALCVEKQLEFVAAC